MLVVRWYMMMINRSDEFNIPSTSLENESHFSMFFINNNIKEMHLPISQKFFSTDAMFQQFSIGLFIQFMHDVWVCN